MKVDVSSNDSLLLMTEIVTELRKISKAILPSPKEEKVSVREILGDYYLSNRQDPYYGWIIVEFSRPLDGLIELGNYAHMTGAQIERIDKISPTIYAVLFKHLINRPEIAYQYVGALETTSYMSNSYNEYTYKVSTPPYRPDHILRPGWLIIRSVLSFDVLKERLELYSPLSSYHEVKKGVYLVLYENAKEDHRWLADNLIKLRKLSTEMTQILTVRALSEEDVELLM